jgi:site-specific recombinase XerD
LQPFAGGGEGLIRLNQRGDERNNHVFISQRRRTRTAMTTSAMWDVVNEAALAVFGADADGRPRKRFGPHAFRHQRAQDLVDSGMPIEDVQAS